jgi:hypothetical protein
MDDKLDLVFEVVIPHYLVNDAIRGGIKSVLKDCPMRLVRHGHDLSGAEDESQPELEIAQQMEVCEQEDDVNELGQTDQEQAPKEDMPNDWDGKQRMIKFRCPECGKINYKMCKGAGDITCFGCGKEYNFDINELSKVLLKCPECGEEQYFWIPEREGMAFASSACRKCGHYMTFSYSATRGIYENF